VFKIPNPDRIKSKIKYPQYVPFQENEKSWIELKVPLITELPYANDSHMEMMLEYLTVDDIVRIFTHMLYEQKTLLIAPKVE